MPSKDPEILKAYRRRYNQENRDSLTQKAYKWAEENPEKVNESAAKYSADNKQKLADRCRAWREKNADKRAAYVKEYGERNREEINARSRAYRAANKEECSRKADEWKKNNPEKNKATRQRWLEINKENIREYTKKRWQEKKEVMSEANRKWQKENPEKIREYSQRRRANEMGSDGTVTAVEIKKLWERQDGKCAYFSKCSNVLGEKGIRGAHRDHIEPLKPKDKGQAPGTHTISNIQLLCASCNSKKRNHDPYKFTQEYEGRLFPDLPKDPKAKKR